MKRITAAIIAAAMLMLFSVSPAPLKAERASAVFSAPSVIVAPGGTVNIPVRISGDYEAHGLNLWLVFDDASFALENVERGEVLSSISAQGGLAVLDTKVENGKNSVRLGVIMPTDPFSTQGVLFTARLTVKPGVSAGTVIPLDLHVTTKDFIYMPIGDHQGQPIPFTLSPGSVTVSNYAPTPTPTAAPTSVPATPTPSPTPRPSSTPTPSPTSVPATPTPRPSSAPATPTPRPGTSSAPATSTPRPGATPTPRPGATPTARPGTTPTGAPATPANTASADPSASIDPYARFGMSPFPTSGVTPGGKVTPEPGGKETPDSGADTAAPDATSSIDPVARFSPTPVSTLEPADPPVAPKIGLLVGAGVVVLAGVAGTLLLLGKKRRDDRDE